MKTSAFLFKVAASCAVLLVATFIAYLIIRSKDILSVTYGVGVVGFIALVAAILASIWE